MSRALNLTHDREVAEDLVVETTMRVFRSISRFNGDSSFKTWLSRITTHCYIDYHRKARSGSA